jgi:hypothetical protein
MINVNQITAQMARMSDQALQQYAAMHKADPYTLSLALSESNRRKEMRQGAQMGQQQPQPKVVDQEIAQMGPQMAPPQQGMPPQGAPQGMPPQQLPEDSGIGQLPAPNMQRMAEGGIVAFEEGGEVPRFQEGGMPDDSGAAAIMGVAGTGLPYVGPNIIERIVSAPGMSEDQKKRAIAQIMQQRAATQPTALAAPASSRALAPSAPPAALAPSAAPAAPPLPAAPAPGATPARGIRPAAGIQGLNPAAGGQGLMAGIPGLTQTATGTAKDFQDMREQFGEPTVSQAVQNKIGTYTLARETEAKAALDEIKADQAKQGLGMEKAEERAKAREGKLGKREADLPGLAIFQAGLAIMSGESPHGLVNIGKGAGVGAKVYTEGLDKLEASRDKLDEAFDKIDMFRQNRADMNAKEVRAAQKDIRATRTEAEKLGLDALQKDGDMNRADSRVAFGVMAENRAKMYDINSRERMGLAQISAQERIAATQAETARLGSPLHMYQQLGNATEGSPLLKGFGLFKEADKIPMLYKAYTSQAADPLRGGEFMARYPTFDVYMAGMGGAGAGGSGFVAPPANAPVLRAPGQR